MHSLGHKLCFVYTRQSIQQQPTTYQCIALKKGKLTAIKYGSTPEDAQIWNNYHFSYY